MATQDATVAATITAGKSVRIRQVTRGPRFLRRGPFRVTVHDIVEQLSSVVPNPGWGDHRSKMNN